jgi:hypothetical protein
MKGSIHFPGIIVSCVNRMSGSQPSAFEPHTAHIDVCLYNLSTASVTRRFQRSALQATQADE